MMYDDNIKSLRLCADECEEDCEGCAYYKKGCMPKMMRDSADAIERLAAQVPRWIPVTERLPEKSGQYLTYNEFGWFNAYPYSIIHKQWNTQDWMSEKSAKGLGINSITHWMPLPQPPDLT